MQVPCRGMTSPAARRCVCVRVRVRDDPARARAVTVRVCHGVRHGVRVISKLPVGGLVGMVSLLPFVVPRNGK